LSAFEKAAHDLRHSPSDFPNVSARWLLGAASITLLGALVCGWLALCILYWQGSWQLLYHPKAAIARTPASASLSYEPIRFATTETGTPQLTGWWLPVADARFTVLYLHGASGNLGDTVDEIAALHRQRLSVFAIDYRGYGQSQPARPSEKLLLQDAEWALAWLTVTRGIPAEKVLVYGTGLGANLAAELATEPATVHSPLGGAILDQPLENAMAPVFDDPRSRLVPAHWLVQDRYDLSAASANLRIPSLWLLPRMKFGSGVPKPQSDAYARTPGPKTAAWLALPATADPSFAITLERWLDDLK